MFVNMIDGLGGREASYAQEARTFTEAEEAKALFLRNMEVDQCERHKPRADTSCLTHEATCPQKYPLEPALFPYL